MNTLLYIIAVVFLLLWAIGYFGYDAGRLIHILMAIAILALLARLTRGWKTSFR
jgi:predicted ferric reductase